MSSYKSIVDEKIILLEHNRKKSIKILIKENRPIYSYMSINKISNILSNILDNSIEAIDNTGEIEIYLEEKNNYVNISILDNGNGFPQQVLDN